MMKKYLMMGIAALALASCSKDDITYVNPDEAKYEMVFVNRFGTPNPNHTWGFGSASRAFTRSENANANEWADPNKAYGGLNVPPALTPEQIAVVKKYFQTHPNLGYQDPKWTNYFIQQVYKGHTDVPEGCATPEAYMAANGETYLIASDYMDHLAAINGNFVDHINNFNHGDCGENDHVLDNGGNANDGPFHTDKIMYMQNSTTKSFGYFNSNGSLCQTNYTALVSYKTIMQEMGAEANCLEDGWNRSFMGFDFEQMIEGQCYASDNEQWDYSTNPATFISSTPKNLTIWGEYYINGVKQTDYVYQYNGQPVKMLSDQMNRYCADVINVTDKQLWSEERDANANNAYLGTKLNTDVIDGLLADGYLPVDNKSLRVWAKVGGCADGYFSDWIVTLAEAKGGTIIPNEYDFRVMAEDLSTNENSDFDFNDIVFDVKYVSSTVAKVKVRAAGGIFPIRIDQNDDYEIHALLGGAVTMLNTFPGHHYDLEAQEIEVSGTFGESADDPAFKAGVREIKIEVSKDGSRTWTELTAPTGKAASKIGVPVSVDWCNEYQDIDEKWGTGAFAAWVQSEQAPFWTPENNW